MEATTCDTGTGFNPDFAIAIGEAPFTCESPGSNRNLKSTSRILKGFCNKAQGCEFTRYPGKNARIFFNLEEVVQLSPL